MTSQSAPMATPSPRRLRLSMRTACLLVLACGLVLFWFAVPARRSVRSRRSTQCMGNLTQLSVALFLYHERYGHFPPAYLADDQGRPMHSWRVLLLEFIDAPLFASYHFDEPWNGPNNHRLAGMMPGSYACSNDYHNPTGAASATSYVAVVGSGTAFPGAGQREGQTSPVVLARLS